MREITWIIDGTTGDLTVEGLPQSELRHWAGDMLPEGKSLNCARPLNSRPISNVRAPIEDSAPALRVFRLYHNSVVEGPGRRSVVQLSGCKQNCPGCFVPETHPIGAGVEMSVAEVVSQLLDPQ